MPNIYVAFHAQGSRLASGSASLLREKVRIYPDTQWNVFKYELKASVEVLALLIEGDPNKWGTPKPYEAWKVDPQGKVRKFDPSKTQVT